MTFVTAGIDRQLSAESKFKDAADQHQEAAKLHLRNAGDNEYESSEDEDDLNDENILDSVLKSFRGTIGMLALYLSLIRDLLRPSYTRQLVTSCHLIA